MGIIVPMQFYRITAQNGKDVTIYEPQCDEEILEPSDLHQDSLEARTLDVHEARILMDQQTYRNYK